MRKHRLFVHSNICPGGKDLKPDVSFLVRQLENLNALLSDTKSAINNTDKKKEVKLIGVPNAYYSKYVYVLTFRPCDDKQGYFVIDREKMPVNGDQDYHESSTSRPYPMTLWDTMLNMKLDQGLTYMDDNLGNINPAKKEVRDFSTSLKNKADSIKNRVIDDISQQVKTDSATKSDFSKTFQDAADVIYDVVTDANQIDYDTILKHLDSLSDDILKQQGGQVSITEENRYKVGTNFLSILDELQHVIAQYDNNQATKFKVDSYRYVRTLYYVFCLVRNIIQENFNRYKRHISSEFPRGLSIDVELLSSAEIKKRLTEGITKTKKFVNDTILNSAIKLTNASVVTEEDVEKDLAQNAESYKNDILSSRNNKIKADKVKERLQKAGVKIYKADDELVQFVKKDIMHNSEYSVEKCRIWKVVNSKTEAAYKATLESDGANANERMLWHGSINTNWESIITNGLSMKYSSGGMFGKGIYFADKSEKSYGYTSGQYSIWAHGEEQRFYLAVFKVNLGRTNTIKNTRDAINETQYDSVTALAGPLLHLNEYVIYDDSRCTICGLVEIYLPEAH